MGVRGGVRGRADEPILVRVALPIRAPGGHGRSCDSSRDAGRASPAVGLLPEDDESALGPSMAVMVKAEAFRKI